MKKNIAGTFLILVVLAFGMVSFLTARLLVLAAHRQPDTASQEWLQSFPRSALTAEQQFGEKVSELTANLRSEQLAFAELLEDSSTSDQVILSQSRKVMSSHEDLIRQVGRHIVHIREQLPEDRKQWFMSLCARSVRGPMCRMTRRQRNGFGRMRGGGGRGFRGGRGGNRWQGGGLAGKLGLTSRQLEMAEKYDPDFQVDIEGLRSDLLQRRANLLTAFENSQTGDADLLSEIDELITVNNRIERRVAKYLLSLRPYLGIEQQKRLVGLCRGCGMSQ